MCEIEDNDNCSICRGICKDMLCKQNNILFKKVCGDDRKCQTLCDDDEKCHKLCEDDYMRIKVGVDGCEKQCENEDEIN